MRNLTGGKIALYWAVILACLMCPPAISRESSSSQESDSGQKISDDRDGKAASSIAEQPRARSGRIIEEVIVTAQKREENIQDVPIAISAHSGERLSNLGITDTRELARLVPGFSTNESGRGSTLFTLRGVGYNDTTYTATSPVGTYIDQINLPYSVMTRGANLDVQRVEVLKGPQGILYGRNTTGGLINYITEKPTEEFEAGTVTSFGRFETLESENFVSGPLLGSLSGRLAFKVIRSYEDWQYSNTRPDDTLGEQNKISARGTLDWHPREELLLRLRVEGWRDRSDPQAPQAVGFIPQNNQTGEDQVAEPVRNYPYLPLEGADPRVGDWPTEAPFPGQLDDQFHMSSLMVRWDISETRELITTITKLRQTSDDSPQIQGLNVFVADLTTNAFIDTVALETRYSDSWWNDRFRWMAGIYLSRDEAREEHRVYTDNNSALFPPNAFFPKELAEQFPPNLLSTRFELIGEPEIEQRAIFINTDTDLSQSLTLNLGARYTENDQEFTGCTRDAPDSEGTGLAPAFTFISFFTAAQHQMETGEPGEPSNIEKGECFTVNDETGSNEVFQGELNETNLAARIALSWKLRADWLLFATASRGFKSGNFPVLNAAFHSQYEPTVQEELLQYELGGKFDFFEWLRTNLTLFYSDYKNKQLLTRTLHPLFGPVPVVKNAPRTHVYGVELDAQASPIEGLSLAFAGSYIKTEVDEFISTGTEGERRDFSDRPFNYAPEVELSFLGDYTFPLTDRLNLGVTADVSYTGDTNGTLDGHPLFEMEGYRTIGARLHLDAIDDTWSVAVWGRNLTDEFVNKGSSAFSEPVIRYTGLPRTYGVTVKYFWR